MFKHRKSHKCKSIEPSPAVPQGLLDAINAYTKVISNYRYSLGMAYNKYFARHIADTQFSGRSKTSCAYYELSYLNALIEIMMDFTLPSASDDTIPLSLTELQEIEHRINHICGTDYSLLQAIEHIDDTKVVYNSSITETPVEEPPVEPAQLPTPSFTPKNTTEYIAYDPNAATQDPYKWYLAAPYNSATNKPGGLDKITYTNSSSAPTSTNNTINPGDYVALNGSFDGEYYTYTLKAFTSDTINYIDSIHNTCYLTVKWADYGYRPTGWGNNPISDTLDIDTKTTKNELKAKLEALAGNINLTKQILGSSTPTTHNNIPVKISWDDSLGSFMSSANGIPSVATDNWRTFSGTITVTNSAYTPIQWAQGSLSQNFTITVNVKQVGIPYVLLSVASIGVAKYYVKKFGNTWWALSDLWSNTATIIDASTGNPTGTISLVDPYDFEQRAENQTDRYMWATTQTTQSDYYWIYFTINYRKDIINTTATIGPNNFRDYIMFSGVKPEIDAQLNRSGRAFYDLLAIRDMCVPPTSGYYYTFLHNSGCAIPTNDDWAALFAYQENSGESFTEFWDETFQSFLFSNFKYRPHSIHQRGLAWGSGYAYDSLLFKSQYIYTWVEDTYTARSSDSNLALKIDVPTNVPATSIGMYVNTRQDMFASWDGVHGDRYYAAYIWASENEATSPREVGEYTRCGTVRLFDGATSNWNSEAFLPIRFIVKDEKKILYE